MRRREFIKVLGGVAATWPLSALAQTASIRLGFLGTGSPSVSAVFVAALKDGLRENGMLEGRDYVLDFAWAEGRYERFPELAAQLVQRKPTASSRRQSVLFEPRNAPLLRSQS